jgi:transcriptional accessory protein Tex/SPT6
MAIVIDIGMCEQGGNWILSTLEDISKELIEPFKDPRDPFQRPSDKEQFSILTKETAQTFYNGKLLMGKVTG